MHVGERVAGHYDVEEVEFGKVYKWVPANARIECDCGQSITVKDATAASCPRCGAEHKGIVKGLGDTLLTKEETYYPTHREYEAWMKDEGSPRRLPERLYGGGLFSGLAAKDEMNRILDVLYGS